MAMYAGFKRGPGYQPYGQSWKRNKIMWRSGRARSRVAQASRGYQRTGGYYGRFNLGGAYSRLRRNPFVRRSDVEKKFIDTTIADATTGTTWEASTSQNLVAQGTTESTRVGRKIVIKNIMCHGRWTLSPTDDGTAIRGPCYIRCLLVLDKQANGAIPATSQVVETDTSVDTFNNLANKDRFKILYSKKIMLNPPSSGGTAIAMDVGGDGDQFEFYKKCNIPIEFDSTAGAITEIRSNNLFWMYVRSDASGTVTFNVTTRLRFTDL